MTVTETRPDPAAAVEAEAPPAPAPTSRGLPAVLGSGDHKVVGRLWIAFSFLFLLVGLGTALLLGVEDADLGSYGVLGSDTYLQVFSLYRVLAVFLVVIPLFIGLATYVVPLQVGARSIALPRAAAAGFWTWLVASGVLLAAYAIDGGPGGTEPDGVELWAVAFGLVLVALLIASISIAATVLAERVEGMTLTRIPLFSWSMLVAASVWILSLPVLGANLLLIYLDHRYGQQLFGVDADVWSQVVWAFHQPQIYAVAIPALGIVGEIFPVASATRPRHREGALAVIGAFGVLSFGAWAQPFFNADARDDILYIAMALAAVLPVLAFLSLAADSARTKRPTLSGPFVLAGVALLVLVGATFAGAVLVIEPLHLVDSSFASGQMNLTLLAALTAGLAGLWYWLPKISGARAGDGAGILAGLALLAGAALVALGQLWAGLLDQPEVLTGDYSPRDGVELLNLVTTVGVVLVLVGVLAAALALVTGVRTGVVSDPADREDDPWGGHTLEWATTSPPPWDNFAEAPGPVTSASPLLDAAEEGA